jgi:hypothetical protein
MPGPARDLDPLDRTAAPGTRVVRVTILGQIVIGELLWPGPVLDGDAQDLFQAIEYPSEDICVQFDKEIFTMALGSFESAALESLCQLTGVHTSQHLLAAHLDFLDLLV